MAHAHSVVPIGGAPFVRPYMTMLRPEEEAELSSFGAHHRRRASVPAEYAPNTPSTSSRYRHHDKSGLTVDSNLSRDSTTSFGGASSFSPTTSSSSSSFSSSAQSSPSSSPTSRADMTSPTGWEAALRYSSALHEHTRRMWEQERSSIERARLSAMDSTGGSSLSNGSASILPSAASSSGLHKRSTLSGGVETFFKGRRRHAKNASVV